MDSPSAYSNFLTRSSDAINRGNLKKVVIWLEEGGVDANIPMSGSRRMSGDDLRKLPAKLEEIWEESTKSRGHNPEQLFDTFGKIVRLCRVSESLWQIGNPTPNDRSYWEAFDEFDAAMERVADSRAPKPVLAPSRPGAVGVAAGIGANSAEKKPDVANRENPEEKRDKLVELAAVFGRYGGFGGLVLFVFLALFLTFGDFKILFPKLDEKHAFLLILCFMILTFLLAVVALVTWVFMRNKHGQQVIYLMIFLLVFILGGGFWLTRLAGREQNRATIPVPQSRRLRTLHNVTLVQATQSVPASFFNVDLFSDPE